MLKSHKFSSKRLDCGSSCWGFESPQPPFQIPSKNAKLSKSKPPFIFRLLSAIPAFTRFYPQKPTSYGTNLAQLELDIADHLTALTLSLLAEHRIHPCSCGTPPRARARGEYVQLFCVTCGRSTKQAQFPLLSDLIREWNGPDKYEVAFRAMVASL
jgi:hypothetical protein